MDSENSFTKGARYNAYVRGTNEKTLLRQYILSEYLAGNLSIKPRTLGKRVLDLGCGTGAILSILENIFANCEVIGLDRSKEQLSEIETVKRNVELINVAFEDYNRTGFDFILVSHVLQYIDTDPEEFILKIIHSLNAGGEVWFILQTKRGMCELISYTRDLITLPRFKNWLTFEDYVAVIETLGFRHEIVILPTSFSGINFKNPSPLDRLRLEFIFCLNQPYQESSYELRERLAKIPYQERIFHPNGIIKIRK